MKDRLSITLLEEIAESKHGRKEFLQITDEQCGRHHQVEMLVDAGFVTWAPHMHSTARITLKGYRHLDGIKHGKRRRILYLIAAGLAVVVALAVIGN